MTILSFFVNVPDTIASFIIFTLGVTDSFFSIIGVDCDHPLFHLFLGLNCPCQNSILDHTLLHPPLLELSRFELSRFL